MNFCPYEVQWPEITHGVFDGMCTVRVNSINFVVLWKERKIFMCDLNDSSSVGVITTRDNVKCVLQVKSEICYLESSGVVNIIKPNDSLSENEDIFELSDDGNRTVNYFRNASCEYLFAVKNTICIHGIESGFVLAKKRGSDLYIDIHKVCGDFITTQCSSSMKLDNVSNASSVSIVFSSYRREHFSVSLRKFLFGIIFKKDVDIVFIGLCGHEYYILVTSQGQCVERPKVLYESAHEISAVMCLPKSSEDFDYVAIILKSGPIVLISYDTKSSSLKHDLLFLPGDVYVVSQLGKYIIAGNGVDLWQCSLKLSTRHILSIEKSLLEIKGVKFISTVGAENKKIIVCTLHNTLYTVSVQESTSSSFQQSSSKEDLSTITNNICKYLEEAAECRRSIIWENGLIASLNLVLRSGQIHNIFSEKIEVFDVNSMSIGCFLSHSVSIGDIEELISKNVSVNNSYVITMTLTNESGIDFVPSFWFIQMSISVDNRTVSKTKELPQNSLLRNTQYNISICTQIECFSNIKLTCNLFGMNPKGELYNTSPVWFKIPVCSRVLDVSYLLQAQYSPTFHLIKDSLSAKPSKHRFLSHLVEGKEVCETKASYCFTLKSSADANSIWSGIVKRCHLHSNNGTKEISENRGNIINMLLGSQSIDIKLEDKNLIVQCDITLLNLMKYFIMDGVEKAGCTMQINENTLIKAMLILEKLKIKQVNPDNFSLFEIKNIWRMFVQENLLLS